MQKSKFYSLIKPDDQQVNSDHVQNPVVFGDISLDPDYKLLMDESQLGNWKECERLINSLEGKYPGNSDLADFRKEFDYKLAILKDMGSSAKEYKKRKYLHYLKNMAILAAAMIGAFLFFWYGSKIVQNNYQKTQLQYKANQIKNLSVQVEDLLNSAQPEKADEIIQNMKAIDPNSPEIVKLSQKRDKIIEINNLYLNAIDQLNNGSDSDALSTLTRIENEYPGYKDVPQLIESTTNKIKIIQELNAGTEAYTAGKWQEAINAFEQVLALDQNNLEVDQQGKLTNSYVYLADQMIKDPTQTADSISQAFNYMEKAVTLNPKDNLLKNEVIKMDLYRAGFKYYVDMNWRSAVQQLSALSALDEGYADGFARQLLFEAHMGQGTQYYSAGSYANAGGEFEIALSLASGKDNLLNSFMAGKNLGLTLGKLTQYEGADSSFTNAIQSISYEQRGTAPATFISDLGNAVVLYKNGQYKDSYDLFSKTLAGENTLFEMKLINARQGNCLALIAAHYQSSVQAILEENNLPQQTVVSSDQKLNIPLLP